MKPRWALYLDLIRFDRPAGWLLLLWPTLMSLWLAARGWPGWHLLAVFVGGTVLMRSAGCCINDVADREFDRHVKRTAQRPITSGQVSVKEALALGAALALVALGLALTTHLAVVLWAIPAVLVTVAYPYAKRWVAMPQAVLGVAFSFGIPMAAVAVRASTGADAAVNAALSWTQPQAWQQAWAVATDLPAWVGWLALGNLCWVVAFDTQYAMVDRDDDLKIGIKTSAITLGRWDVAAVALLNGFWMLFWALSIDGINFNAIFFVVLAVSALQVLWHLWLIRGRERAACFKAFRLSHWLGLTWFVGVVLALL